MKGLPPNMQQARQLLICTVDCDWYLLDQELMSYRYSLFFLLTYLLLLLLLLLLGATSSKSLRLRRFFAFSIWPHNFFQTAAMTTWRHFVQRQFALAGAAACRMKITHSVWRRPRQFLICSLFLLVRSGTDLLSLLILLLLFLLGKPLQKNLTLRRFESDQDEIWQEFFQVNRPTRRLTESDFGYDDTLSRWRSWRHFRKKPNRGDTSDSVVFLRQMYKFLVQ